MWENKKKTRQEQIVAFDSFISDAFTWSIIYSTSKKTPLNYVAKAMWLFISHLLENNTTK